MSQLTRRHFIVGAAACGTATLVGRPSSADLHCQDMPASPMAPPHRTCESGLPSSMIHVVAKRSRQEQSQWCWAACISMVFAYHKHPVAQTRIVKECYGRLINLPADPWTMLRALNRVWIDDNGKKFRARSSGGTTDPASAARDLVENRPLILGTRGHAVVLTSLQYSAAYYATPLGLRLGPVVITGAVVRDPWPGRGRRVLTPREWAGITFATHVKLQKIQAGG